MNLPRSYERAANQKWPRISIVTPSYNQEQFLEETICSVLDQGYPNLEYIIIDGGSTDKSSEIIRKYAAHLAYHCSEPDRGHYDAVNKGFARSTGEIMAFLNSDDKYFPGALRIVAESFLCFPEISWIASLLPAMWDLHGNCIDIARSPGYSREAFLDDCYGGKGPLRFGPIQQESTFWRRSLWEAIAGRIRSDISHAADFDLWCRFYAHADLYGLVAPLGGFRIRAGQRGEGGRSDLYTRQRLDALSEAREKLLWKPSFFREFSIRCRLFDLPKIKLLARKFLGYPAKRIVRLSAGSREESWAIQQYRFP